MTLQQEGHVALRTTDEERRRAASLASGRPRMSSFEQALAGADGAGRRAGPRQPDRRAHRLQRRLRPARSRSPSGRASSSRRATTGSVRVAERAGRATTESLALGPSGPTGAGSTTSRGSRALRRARRPIGGFECAIDSDRAGRERPVLERRAGGEPAARAARGVRADDRRRGAGPAGPAGRERFVGARVGIMDQIAASLADSATALFVDTRSLAYERLPLRRRPSWW